MLIKTKIKEVCLNPVIITKNILVIHFYPEKKALERTFNHLTYFRILLRINIHHRVLVLQIGQQRKSVRFIRRFHNLSNTRGTLRSSSSLLHPYIDIQRQKRQQAVVVHDFAEHPIKLAVLALERSAGASHELFFLADIAGVGSSVRIAGRSVAFAGSLLRLLACLAWLVAVVVCRPGFARVAWFAVALRPAIFGFFVFCGRLKSSIDSIKHPGEIGKLCEIVQIILDISVFRYQIDLGENIDGGKLQIDLTKANKHLAYHRDERSQAC